jgi:hypothetical protein
MIVSAIFGCLQSALKAVTETANRKELWYASGEGRRLGCLSVKSVWLPIPRE